MNTKPNTRDALVRAGLLKPTTTKPHHAHTPRMRDDRPEPKASKEMHAAQAAACAEAARMLRPFMWVNSRPKGVSHESVRAYVYRPVVSAH